MWTSASLLTRTGIVPTPGSGWFGPPSPANAAQAKWLTCEGGRNDHDTSAHSAFWQRIQNQIVSAVLLEPR
jgi:hypothetical protein